VGDSKDLPVSEQVTPRLKQSGYMDDASWDLSLTVTFEI